MENNFQQNKNALNEQLINFARRRQEGQSGGGGGNESSSISVPHGEGRMIYCVFTKSGNNVECHQIMDVYTNCVGGIIVYGNIENQCDLIFEQPNAGGAFGGGWKNNWIDSFVLTTMSFDEDATMKTEESVVWRKEDSSSVCRFQGTFRCVIDDNEMIPVIKPIDGSLKTDETSLQIGIWENEDFAQFVGKEYALLNDGQRHIIYDKNKTKILSILIVGPQSGVLFESLKNKEITLTDNDGKIKGYVMTTRRNKKSNGIGGEKIMVPGYFDVNTQEILEGLDLGHGYTDVLDHDMRENVNHVKKEPSWLQQKIHRTRKHNTFKGPNKKNTTMKPTTNNPPPPPPATNNYFQWPQWNY